MRFYCRICGEELTGREQTCPNCQSRISSSTIIETDNNTASAQDSDKTVAAEDTETGSCPRCGEILKPGANVCEVCGEVITPVKRQDAFSATLYNAVEEDSEAELPMLIETSGSKAQGAIVKESAGVKDKTLPVKTDTAAARGGGMSLYMLILICVLVALIAVFVTWAVIHFSDNETEVSDMDQSEEQIDFSMLSQETETAAIPQASSPLSAPSAPAEPLRRPSDLSGPPDEPIEGMRESLAGTWTFYGKVDNKHSIGMDLEITPDGIISGCYWYDATLRQNGDEPSTFITLDGEVDDTGRVKLTAFKNGENAPYEYWRGHLSGVSPLKFQGTFRNVASGTTYKFTTLTKK